MPKIVGDIAFNPTPLRVARKAQGKSTADVASEVGCSDSLVKLTELGYKRPSPERLAAIARAVGVSLDALFVEDPDEAA